MKNAKRTRVLLATFLGCGAVFAAEPYEVSTVPELTNALTQAATDNNAVVITLAKGTYDLSAFSPMSDNGILYVKTPKSRKMTIQGDPSVSREEVILDGGQVGRILHLDYYTNDATVQNLTFRNGKESDNKGGAAVWCASWGNHYFRNCVFEGNVARGSGGAVYGNNTYFYDCLFVTNSAGGHGGATRSAKVLSGCTFRGNKVTGSSQNGGAYRGSGTVTNCVFDANELPAGLYGAGGAIYCEGGSIVDCDFTNAVIGANNSNGALYLNATGAIQIRGCKFYRTTSRGSGAAIFCKTASAESEFVDSYFCENDATGASSYYGGAVASFPGLVSNCTFVANKAYRGGAIYNCTNVRHCVFAGNRAENVDWGDGGGAAYKSALYDGCVVTNNSALVHNGGFVSCTVCNSYVGGNRADRKSKTQDSSDCTFDGCEFVGNKDVYADESHFSGCVFSRSVIRGYRGNRFIGGTVSVTNTLFFDNVFDTMFRPAGAANEIVNCSFVGNRYDQLGSPIDASPMAIVNCMFYRQKKEETDETDDIGNNWNSFCWTNNYFTTSQSYKGAGNLNTRSGAPANPKLMLDRDPQRPFAPQRKSCLNGAGFVMDWMATATDLDGNPRLTNGKVAIGAYETTDFYVPGLMLLFR